MIRRLVLADCLALLKTLPDVSVDAVVTDPPYGLSEISPEDVASALRCWLDGKPWSPRAASVGFMGQSWDAFVPGPEVWRECLRVLKPGGHLLCFAGSRTVDLMGIAIRLAGFEIRDELAWLYGQGGVFSQDVAKRLLGAGAVAEVAKLWRGWNDRIKPAHEPIIVARKEASVVECLSMLCASVANLLSRFRLAASPAAESATARRPARRRAASSAAMDTSPCWSDASISSSTASSWLRTWEGISDRASTFTIETASVLTIDLIILSSSLSKIMRENTPQAPIPPSESRAHAAAVDVLLAGLELKSRAIHSGFSALAHATSPTQIACRVEAVRLESILLARKPLIGTIAENVLRHGCGAVNVDGCRVETAESTTRNNTAEMGYHGGNLATSYRTGSDAGRWPANVVHDGSAEVLALFPESAGQLAPARNDGADMSNNVYGKHKQVRNHVEPRGDVGSAGRFFKACPFGDDDLEAAVALYCAKATRTERREGQDDLAWANTSPPTPITLDQRAGLLAAEAFARFVSRQEVDFCVEVAHPTVKPVALMRWLCRLVTRPGGVVLDPFAGSGTTLRAAAAEGFGFVGCEREPPYAEIARRRAGLDTYETLTK